MDSENAKNLLGNHGSGSKTNDVPIEHLDYVYISNCSKVRELEKILKILRSGEEGYFPDLIDFCEKRIAEIEPNSRILRKEKSSANKYDLGSEEWGKVNTDIKDWTNDISHIEEVPNSEVSDQKIPPIRKGVTIDMQGKQQRSDTDEKMWGKPSKDRIESHDYSAWEKFDAEAEAKKVDGLEDKGQRLKNAAAEISMSRSAANTPAVINVEGMSDRDREVVANREKDKGNEAFKSSDFEEAVTYYSRSICVIPSAPAYNNRALARIKLGLFSEAAMDCGKVLDLEPDNIKAFLRRGTARKSLHEFAAARQDLDRVLSIEPQNKQAEDLLVDIATKEAGAKKQKKTNKKEIREAADVQQKTAHKSGRRLVIEEIDGSDSEEELVDAKQNLNSKEGGDSNLVNGVSNDRCKVGDTVETEDTVMPANSAKDSEVPDGGSLDTEKKNFDTLEVTHNILSRNGSGDEVDGACASRPARDKEVMAENDQNRLNSNHEKQLPKESPKDVNGATPQESSTSEPTNVNGAMDANPVDTLLTQTTPIVPLAPIKVERPLPAEVVALKDTALTFYKAGQYGYALDKFTRAIERLVPEKEEFGSALASLYSNRAACYTRTGEPKDCIEDCGASLDINPYNTKVLLRRGAAYEMREKYGHAYVDFQMAMTFDPLNRVAQEACSRLLRILQERDGSRWRDKLPSHPNMPSLPKMPPILTTTAPSKVTTPAETLTTKSTMTTMASGQGLDVKGQAKDKPEVMPSKGEKNTALTKDERFQKVKDEGNGYFKKGVYAEAVRCYTSCIETDPTQVVSYTNRALCYLKLNQFVKAETDCSMALALDTNNIKALYRRALSRKGLKEYKKSAQDLTTLLKTDNQNKDAKKELDLVKDLWRKELTASKGDSTKSAPKKVKTEKKPTRVQIQESDTDSNEEKENSTQVRPNQKSSSKSNKGIKADKTSAKDSRESEKPAKHSGSKKTGRTNSTKSSTTTVPKLSKVTAYEFMQAWMSLKGTKNLAGYAELLKQVPPTELPRVLTNKLDGDMLVLILRSTSEHIVEKDAAKGYAILFNLVAVDRFNTVVLFMAGKDKKSLRKAFDYLESTNCDAYMAEDIKKLRKNYAL